MRAADAARAAAAAVAFLTRLPVGWLIVLDGTDVARGAACFPLVGAGVGAAVGGIAVLLLHVLPPFAAAGIAIAAGALATGALHLDALADMADAMTAGGDRALAIMRDHSIGAYGAVALTLDLIVKTAALAGLAVHHHALWPAIAAGAFSRSVPAVLGGTLPSVRSDGAGAAFRVTRAALVAAVAIAVGLAAALGGVRGLELAGIVAAGGFLLALCFRRWLGGVTGDLLGASVELTETLALVAAAALTGSH